MRKTLLAFPIACVALSGCAGQFAIGQAPGLVTNAAGQIDTVVNQIILQKAMDLHNLEIGLAQIEAAPGMVTSVSPPQVIAAPTPAAPVVPAPTPIKKMPKPRPAPKPVPAPLPTVPTPVIPMPAPVPTPAPVPVPPPTPAQPPLTGTPGTFPTSPVVAPQ